MSKARLIPGALDFTYRAVIKSLIFVVGIVLVVATVRAMLSNHIVIEPISVPHKLEEDGYSGVVVARLLLEEVQKVRRSGETLHFRDPDQPPVAGVSFLSEDDFATLAAIQVPSSSLSLRSITVMLKDFLGYPERKIGGAITIRRADGQPPVYTVSLLMGSSVAPSAKPQQDTNLDVAIRLSAHEIARQYDPVGLAAYYLATGKLRDMKELADAMIEKGELGQRKEGLLLRGLSENKENRTFDAIEFFKQAIKEDPRYSEAYDGWGTALAQEEREKHKEAIEKYGEAIKLNPSNASAYRNRGIAYQRLQDYERAVPDFKEATRLNPNDAASFFELGWAYERLGKYEAAAKAYGGAIRVDRKHVWALNNRCYMRAILREGSAIADCNEALRLEKDYRIYDSRGFAYLVLGEFDKAIVDYSRALSFKPKPEHAAWSLFGRGVAKRKNRDIEGGDADIRQALELDDTMDKKMAEYDVRP